MQWRLEDSFWISKGIGNSQTKQEDHTRTLHTDFRWTMDLQAEQVAFITNNKSM